MRICWGCSKPTRHTYIAKQIFIHSEHLHGTTALMVVVALVLAYLVCERPASGLRLWAYPEAFPRSPSLESPTPSSQAFKSFNSSKPERCFVKPGLAYKTSAKNSPSVIKWLTGSVAADARHPGLAVHSLLEGSRAFISVCIHASILHKCDGHCQVAGMRSNNWNWAGTPEVLSVSVRLREGLLQSMRNLMWERVH